VKVVVASENQVKINAVFQAFNEYFNDIEVEGVEVGSGVSVQPLTNNETLIGARNRVKELRKRINDADYWVAIEGGVQASEKGLSAFAWIVIYSAGKFGEARTGSFILPQKVAHLIAGGLELGTANDIIFGVSNSKQNAGAVGLLTHNRVDRTELYRQAVILALIPFINPELY
jgi:inosine/xanthosine triphosphatase